MNKKTNAIHPQIYSLLKLKDYVREMMMTRQYEKAIRGMYYLYIEVEEKDRDVELFTKIKTEVIVLDGFSYPSGRKARVKTMESVYKKWWEHLEALLRAKGYMTNQKYGFDIEEDDTVIE